MNDSRWTVDPTTGCWGWAGPIYQRGYGRHREMNAHRAIWIELRGPLPSGRGWALDHLCRNRKCVNPDHMEFVTRRENILRGESPTAINAAKTHCINGHEFTSENTLPNGPWRKCRACHLAVMRSYHARRRLAAAS